MPFLVTYSCMKLTFLQDAVFLTKENGTLTGQRETVPQGTQIDAEIHETGIRFEFNGKKKRISWAYCHKYFKAIGKAPTLKTLEKWCSDGVAKTPFGKRVEPDGTDEFGAPSWVRAMGLI